MLTALAALACLISTFPAPAEAGAITLAAPREFELDFTGQQPEPDAAAPAADTPAPDPQGSAPTPGFGSAGSQWLAAGGALAYDFDEDYDLNAHFMWSTFLADRLEFGIEGAAWYFNQVGEDTGGISGMFIFRYHWWSGPMGDFDWTSFLDFGTGVLVGFDEVPDGGTGFNFIQRAGLGFTKDLDSADGPAHGARLVFGIRWHHISNGRFSGDERNPSRDSILGFVGVQWDF